MILTTIPKDRVIMFDIIMEHLKTPLSCEEQQAIRDGIEEGFREIAASRRTDGPQAVTMLARKPKKRRFFRKRG